MGHLICYNTQEVIYMDYTELLMEADANNLITKEKPLRANKGRIKGNRIAIQNTLTETEKKCVLAEELGHHYTTTGDILNQSSIENRKQEQQARTWAYNKLIGLMGIVDSYKAGCHNAAEMAEHLNVTEEFLMEALERYRNKYGTYTAIDNYVIFFEPSLGVLEIQK